MAEMLISMTQRVYCEELKAMAEEDEEEEGEEDGWTAGEEYIPAEDTLEYVPRVRHLPILAFSFVDAELWEAPDVSGLR